MMSRISMLRCGNEPAKGFKGHSQARPTRPIIRLSIWRTGTGETAASRFFETKSQKTLGQMKHSMVLAIWSEIASD